MLDDDGGIGKVMISDNETLERKRKKKRGKEGKEGINGSVKLLLVYCYTFFFDVLQMDLQLK